MSEEPTIPSVTLTIDGHSITVPKGTTVYTAAKHLGIELPIFCYQDRMPPLGACRVCLVAVEKMGKLQASCTLEATDGMVISTQSSAAVEGRRQILELLLINHPLDCPICDKGGECPLQEQALSHGGGASRFFEEKRHFPKAKSLGPLLVLDRERCIACARCTRFSELIAGDHALELYERGYKTEVGTPGGDPINSKFIGNTISICPVGALTSHAYRFRSRPWDLSSTESSCTLCPIGCRAIYDERDGEIMRTRACETRDLNDIWLCDKGWFGYTFASHRERLQTPLVRKEGTLVPVTWEEALSCIADALERSATSGHLAGWGGNILTFEESYLFQELIRCTSGANHVDHRIGMPLFKADEEAITPGMEISLGEAEELHYAFILGCDLTEEFPILWLRLKQAHNKGAPLFYCGHFAPEISRYFASTHLHPPGSESDALTALQPVLENISQKGRGALFVGSQYLASPQRSILLSTLSSLCDAIPDLSLNLLEGRGNSMGARLAGMHPERGPFNAPLDNPGRNPIELLKYMATNGWECLYTAGTNPANKYPQALWKEARQHIRCLIAHELFLTETAAEADIVLPVLSSLEKNGHFINIEGRPQSLKAARPAPENLLSDGAIFSYIAKHLNIPLELEKIAQNLQRYPSQLLSPRRIFSPKAITHDDEKILRATFSHLLFDEGERMCHSDPLSQLTPPPKIRLHPETAYGFGLSCGDHVLISSEKGQLQSQIVLDSGIAKDTLLIPLGFRALPICELTDNPLNGLPVTLSQLVL